MKKLIKPLCLLTGLLCAPAVLLHAQSVAARRDKGFRDIRLEKESVGNCDAV